MEKDFLFGKQRLVGECRRDIVLAGNVGRGDHRDDAGRGADGGEIEPDELARRLVRHTDCDVQRSRGLADVVEVGRGAAHVQTRRIVGMRLMDDAGLFLQRNDRDFDFSIRQHGGLRDVSARLAPKFQRAGAK